jgi:predicted DNA-binding transcriptional regulator AlpA
MNTDARVLFLDDLCAELQVSRRTVERLRRHGAFPIPELPSLDKRPRWSRVAVDAYLASSHETTVTRRRGGRKSNSLALVAR